MVEKLPGIVRLPAGRVLTFAIASACISGWSIAGADLPEPEISNLAPRTIGHHEWFWGGAGFPSEMLHTITGENFSEEETVVLAWDIPERSPVSAELLRKIVDGELQLPSRPPEGSVEVAPVDIEPQVLMVPLVSPNRAKTYNAAWVRTKAGVSAPILFNTAIPGWIAEASLQPGQLLRIFGHGLWHPYVADRSIVLLSKSEQKIFELTPINDRGIDRSGETRLMDAHLPRDLLPDAYQVFIHNGLGGDFGWALAGEIEVTAAESGESTRVFDVREFGAVGDGIANDHAGIKAAIQAAFEAGGGTVRLPVGTFRTDRSIQLRPGVVLRGAGRENTILEGFGYDPTKGYIRRDQPNSEPAPVVTLTDDTGLGNLTVRGMLSHGPVTHWGTALVCVFPAGMAETPVEPGDVRGHGRYHAMQGGTVRDFFVEECYLETMAEPPHPAYRFAFHVVGIEETERARLRDNVIKGGIWFGRGAAIRADLIRNRVQRGGLSLGSLIDGFVDENIFEDGPARFFSYRPVRNSYFRSNEIYGFGRRSSAGGAEAFMFHGSHGKLVGTASAATPTSLTDQSQSWESERFPRERHTVVITAGRGFGQYRAITGNSENAIEIAEPWRVVPDETSEYVISRFFVDSVFFDNYQDHLAQMWLWFDCLNITVENHRDDHGGGIDLFGVDTSDEERPDRFNPSWFNMLVRNNMHGSRLALWGEDSGTSSYRGPFLFANYLIDNQIVRPSMRPVGDNVRRVGPQAGIDFNYYLMRHHEPSGRITHTVAVRNVITDAEIGIRIPRWVSKTFLSGNIFINVQQPILDAGSGTMLRENILEFYDPEDGELQIEPLLE